jgi:biotin carboxylase
MRALLLVHQGSRLTPSLVALLREKGLEPFVLSSATFDGAAAFGKVASELGVGYRVSESAALTVDEVVDTARELDDCAFCFTVWDGQRVAMARANEVLGARDASAAAIALALDKHLLRRELVRRGLSRLRPFRLDDAELRERLDRGERHILKPRRGTASLCTRTIESWGDVEEALAVFGRGPGEEDAFIEFYEGNELIAETFFDGAELSFELIRQDGRSVLSLDHERTVLEFTGETVLERAWSSPPVLLTPEQVELARRYVERVMDELGHTHGCYHVEVRVGADDHCELIEINPRAGGQFVVESVRVQLDRSVGHDWIDTLTGTPVTPAGERTCGTFFQTHFLEPGRQVLGLERNPNLPAPAVFSELPRPEVPIKGDREVIGAMSLWRTELDTHRETVDTLLAEEYCSFIYARGLSGRPLFLVFEPTNHLYPVCEAADRKGFDVVAFHSLPLATWGPYAGARHNIALAVPIPAWEDWDDCSERVLAVCEGREVAGSYAALELLLEFDARMQERLGIPGKKPAEVHRLLDKVAVRRRLAEHGLTRLQVFEESEFDELREWPVGDKALFLKPVRGAGSVFVTRCRNLDEVHAALAEWKAADKAAIPILGPYLDSEGGAVFLEEEAVGELLSVEGFVHQGEYHFVGLTSRTMLVRDPSIEMGWSMAYRHPRRDDIVDTVRRMHEALAITHGITHLEVMVPDEGPVELVEANLRLIGMDCIMAMNIAYGIRFEDMIVELFAGEMPAMPTEAPRFTCLHNLLPPYGLRRLESVELADVESLPFHKLVFPGPLDLASTDRQIDYIASFAVCGDTYEDALARAVDIRRRTLVNGRPLGDDPNNVVIPR